MDTNSACSPEGRLRTFTLQYVQDFSDGEDDTFLFRCEAEDYDHAIERLVDAEEGVREIELFAIGAVVKTPNDEMMVA